MTKELAGAERRARNRALVDGYVRDCVVSPSSLPPRPSAEVVVAITEILEELDRLTRREATATEIVKSALCVSSALEIERALHANMRQDLAGICRDARRFLGTEGP